MWHLELIALSLLAQLVYGIGATSEATWVYPPPGSAFVFNSVDTVNASWTSSYQQPHLRLWCKAVDQPKYTSRYNAAVPATGYHRVLLNIIVVASCYFDIADFATKNAQGIAAAAVNSTGFDIQSVPNVTPVTYGAASQVAQNTTTEQTVTAAATSPPASTQAIVISTASTSATAATQSSSAGGGISTGEGVGIGISVALGTILLVLSATVLILRARRRRKQGSQEESAKMQDSDLENEDQGGQDHEVHTDAEHHDPINVRTISGLHEAAATTPPAHELEELPALLVRGRSVRDSLGEEPLSAISELDSRAM